jgi:hypothetical protein
MKQNQIVATIVALVTIIGGVGAALNYFAKAAELQAVELRLDQKIQGDNILRIQYRIWQLEDRYQGQDCSQWVAEDRDEYRNLKLQFDMMKKEMEGQLKNSY